MASSEAVELCKVVLQDFFGPIAVAVASVLLGCGRLEAATVSRKARVSLKLTRQSLVVMIQHNLVLFVTLQEKTFYECDVKEILNLLKTGKVMRWASETVSPEAAALVKYVAMYGKVKAKDLISAFSTSSSQVSEDRNFDHVLLKLMQAKILRTAQLHECKPIEDLKQSLRDEEMQRFNGMSMPESRKAKEVEERLSVRLQALRDANDAPEMGLKRRADGTDSGRPRKKMRVMDEDDALVVDGDVMLRINYDKFAVHQRNQVLVRLCRTRLGPTPAAVYGHILDALEPRIFTCRQNTSAMSISTLTISRALPDDFDLARVWAKPTTTKTSGKAESLDDDDNEESDLESVIDRDDAHDLASDDDDEDAAATATTGSLPGQEKIKLLNKFLTLLAADSIAFLTKCGTRSMGEWRVEYATLVDTLRQIEIDAFVLRTHDDPAPRLLRIVRDKGKVEEKQLASTALCQQKDIYKIAGQLHVKGLLELQAVPKRLDRQPSMTYFLYYYDATRATSSLAQHQCRAMARCHQRLATELQARQRLLDKSQRTDVREREAEYLSRGELDALRNIRRVEERILTQSMRMADTYAILVDY